MLYILCQGNHAEVTYAGGEEPIVHLEADLHDVVAWAGANGCRWAFTPVNASAAYAPFRSDLRHLDEIDWAAVVATDWRAQEIPGEEAGGIPGAGPLPVPARDPDRGQDDDSQAAGRGCGARSRARAEDRASARLVLSKGACDDRVQDRRYHRGADAEALVNTVNCVGIMGGGIALQFKNAFPENFRAYEAACRRNEVQPVGCSSSAPTSHQPELHHQLPYQRHWRGKSRIEDIESGLRPW